ncbi:MAG: class I SAM-dependent methyltransferase [Anaerolineaceae bacterium]|nr:class I SAM-dependent methyltransferase [Anaerolineaceae bacterium]
MANEHDNPNPEDFFWFETQEIDFSDFECEGFILDIGGGGEGIIGQLKGSQVIAIDPKKRELENAADGPLKIIMDARELKFLDGSFQTATAFYSLMYMSEEIQKVVLKEIHRVLKTKGELIIWDISLLQPFDTTKRGFIVPLKVKLPDRVIETGYGNPWPENDHDISYYRQLAEETGFILLETSVDGINLVMKIQKP